MAQQNVEIVRRAIASFNTGDMVAVAELFHPAAEWRDLSHAPDTAEVLVGVDAIIAAGGQWSQVFDEFSAEVYEYIDAHPWVVCDTRWSGKGRGSAVGVDIRQADAYEVEDGKVVRAVLAYADVASALQAIELREQETSSENVEVVKRGFEHFMSTGEPHWESFHGEVEVHDHDTMDQGEYRGHAGVGHWLADWTAAWSEFSMEPEEFLDAGERIVMFFCMKATGVSSGLALERQDAMVFKVSDGKVVRIDYYNNRSEALKNVGLKE